MCNFGVAKIKNFVALKTKSKKWEDENIFVEDIFDKRFIQIYEQLLQLNKENK